MQSDVQGGAAKLEGDRQEGDRFEASVRPLLAGLRSAALKLTRNSHDAEDLLQETTLRAWRFWAHYESGSNLKAWLHRILLNTFVNGYRRARRERELLQQGTLGNALHPAPASEEPSLLRGALSDELAFGLSALPPEFRAVLWAVAVDELSYREAADTLGCPVGTVMSRLHRARRLMQSALARPASAVAMPTVQPASRAA